MYEAKNWHKILFTPLCRNHLQPFSFVGGAQDVLAVALGSEFILRIFSGFGGDQLRRRLGRSE
jgi:hypothetical protein